MSFEVKFFSRISKKITGMRSLKQGQGMIILAGMPKSGTTAVAKLLGHACSKSVISDPFYQLDRSGVIYREALFSGDLSLGQLWKANRNVFHGRLIKEPNFPLLLPQLIDFLPKANCVFLVRDPRQNIRSILNRVNLPGDPSAVDLSMSDVGGTWKNLLLGVNPAMPGDNYVERLAWRWRLSAEAINKFSDKGCIIRYEDFNANKKGFIRDLASELGYKKTDDVSHMVDIQFQPKGNASVAIEDFFGWVQLQAINDIVGDQLVGFGYE